MVNKDGAETEKGDRHLRSVYVGSQASLCPVQQVVLRNGLYENVFQMRTNFRFNVGDRAGSSVSIVQGISCFKSPMFYRHFQMIFIAIALGTYKAPYLV